MLSTDLMLVTILTWSFSEGTTIYKEVLINETTKISCFPNKDIQIQWHHPSPSRSSSHLYAGGRFHDESNRGFRLEKDSNTGPYHLIIPHTRTEDAGLYKCKDDATGPGMYDSTQLTVLESNLVCGSNMRHDGYVGPTTCNLGKEEMIFTCAVSFSGKHPQMTWKILNGRQSFNESMCKIENGRINCSLIIKADSKYDETIFNCQSTKSTAECSTNIIKIHYFEKQMPRAVVKNVGEKVNCSVKSNQELEFNWTRVQGDQHLNVTKKQELLIETPDLHRCYVDYRIRNVPCDTLVTNVNVQNPSTTVTTPKKSPKAGTAAISVPSIFVVISIVVIIVGNVILGVHF